MALWAFSGCSQHDSGLAKWGGTHGERCRMHQALVPKGDETCVIYLAMLEVSDFKVPILSLSLLIKNRNKVE